MSGQIENVMQALPHILSKHKTVVYMVAGATNGSPNTRIIHGRENWEGHGFSRAAQSQ